MLRKVIHGTNKHCSLKAIANSNLLVHRSSINKSKRRSDVHRTRSLVTPIVAYHHTEDVKDWRTKKMIELCQDYFQKLWSKGDMSIADKILDPEFIHHDRIWRKKKLIVGPDSMKDFVVEIRKAYPNLFVQPMDFADGSIEHIFVQFEGWGTNLGKIQGESPTGHHSNFTGIGVFQFNHDRSFIKEVNVWRTPMTEDRVGGVDADNPLEVHLARLHFD